MKKRVYCANGCFGAVVTEGSSSFIKTAAHPELFTVKRTALLLSELGLCVVCLTVVFDWTKQPEKGQPKTEEKDAAQQGQRNSGRGYGCVQQ